MATTTERPRSATAAKASKPQAAAKARPGGKATKPKAAATAGTTKKAVKPGAARVSKELVSAALPTSGMKRKLVLMLVRKGAKKLMEAGGRSVGGARQRVLDASGTAAGADSRRRPPIQCSIDAGVPVRVAWQEWIKLEWLPEGIDDVEDIERGRRGKLRGRTAGSEKASWRAEVLDEREEQSFAWQSRSESDCAGLITFHELGERLTRIELSLDVVPVTVTQAAALSARVADRRTRAGLRRFKARLELINPDLYEDAAASG
jgi:uncharacterized membrane protein